MTEKRSVNIKGHRTSYSLEREFHDALQAIASRKGLAIAKIVAEVDAARDEQTNLSSALRLFVLNDLMARLTEANSSQDR